MGRVVFARVTRNRMVRYQPIVITFIVQLFILFIIKTYHIYCDKYNTFHLLRLSCRIVQPFLFFFLPSIAYNRFVQQPTDFTEVHTDCNTRNKTESSHISFNNDDVNHYSPTLTWSR